MFYYEVPQFEKKRLLRTEMLEQIRDFPRDYLEILYAGYSDGILHGCTPRWNEHKLVIEPGILRYLSLIHIYSDRSHGAFDRCSCSADCPVCTV